MTGIPPHVVANVIQREPSLESWASKDTVSRITDRVIEEMQSWSARPLERVYAAININAIMGKIRDGLVKSHRVMCPFVSNFQRFSLTLARWLTSTRTRPRTTPLPGTSPLPASWRHNSSASACAQGRAGGSPVIGHRPSNHCVASVAAGRCSGASAETATTASNRPRPNGDDYNE